MLQSRPWHGHALRSRFLRGARSLGLGRGRMGTPPQMAAVGAPNPLPRLLQGAQRASQISCLPRAQEKAGCRLVGAPQAALRSHVPPEPNPGAGHRATASLILNHLLRGLGFSPVAPHSLAGASISNLCWIHHANLVFVPGISPGNESGVDGRSWEHFTLTHCVRAGDAGR